MKIFLTFLVIPLMLLACGGGDVDKLQAERDSLAQTSEAKDATINDFIKSFNQIESNLEMIKQKENIISVQAHGDVELDDAAKDKINDDILTIYELMNKNKNTISRLEKQLKRANINASELKKMIKNMESELRAKDEQIESLKNELAKLNIDMESLNKEIAALSSNKDTLEKDIAVKEEVIEVQDQKLNTAYYVAGTKKELKDHKIITSEGGFIGIGRMQKLMENFNKDYFKTVDIRSLQSVPLFAKNAKLITSHPSSSYYFAGKDKMDSLVIKNSADFWSVSKYLVIMVE
jgi:predicted  nucleic acid-binding Zn-ribbon protein